MSATISSIAPMGGDVSLFRSHWVQIVGSGFIPNLAVAIYMRDSSGTPPGLFCTSIGPTDANGNLNAAFKIPSFSTPYDPSQNFATYTVTACNAVKLPDGTGRSIGASASVNVSIL